MLQGPFNARVRAAMRAQLLRWRSAVPRRRPQSTSTTSNASVTSLTSSPTAESAIPTGAALPAVPLWQRATGAFARTQRKHPYLTQLAGALLIYGAADFSAQRMGEQPWDPARTARTLAIGAGFAIPGYHWFLFLDRRFNYANSRLLSLAVKVAVNQAVFTPVFNTYFFGAQALLSGEGVAGTIERIKRTVPVSVVNSLKVWPAVTAFSFTFIPVEFRFVFAGTVAVGWQTYLSYLNRVAEREQAAKRAAAISGATM